MILSIYENVGSDSVCTNEIILGFSINVISQFFYSNSKSSYPYQFLEQKTGL